MTCAIGEIDKSRCVIYFSTASKPQVIAETLDSAKMELYRLIGEGYKAMQEDRTRILYLCNPQAAQRISDGILSVADKLATFPEAHPAADEELRYLKR